MSKIREEGYEERENVRISQGQEIFDAGINDRHYEPRTLCETLLAHPNHISTVSTSPSVSTTGDLAFLFESHRYDVSNAKLRDTGQPCRSGAIDLSRTFAMFLCLRKGQISKTK